MTTATTQPQADVFTSSVPWEGTEPDCLVIACSDHRFTPQIAEFVQHLGFAHPHIVRIPGGAVISNPLLSAVPFLSKFLDFVIERAIEMKGLKTVICIAHEDCGAYKEGGKHSLLGTTVRRLTGKSVRETHLSHVAAATRRLKHTLPGTTVKAFFADISEGTEKKVTFHPIPV